MTPDTAQELLDAAATRATAGATVDAGAALARAGRRRTGRRRRLVLAGLAGGAVAASGLGLFAVGVRVPGGGPGVDGLVGATPGPSDFPPSPRPTVVHAPLDPGSLGSAVLRWVARNAGSLLVGTLLLLAVLLLVVGWRIARRRLSPAARRRARVGALVLLAVLPLGVPALLSAELVRWTRAPGTPAGSSRTAPGPVLPRVIADQRMAPPAAFDQVGRPRTTRVAAVFRAVVAGQPGMYGVDAASGGTVRLDTVTGIFGTPLEPEPEVAVSPNGRFVATARAGDDRSTGTGAGATVIDLATASWRSVPLLAPPGRSVARVAGPSTTFAVLDDGTLVVVRDANRSLWLYPSAPPVGQRRELPAFGAVDGVIAVPGDRFVVWRPDPGREPRSTTGLPFGGSRIDVVQASTGTVLAFAPQLAFVPAPMVFVDAGNVAVDVWWPASGALTPLQPVGAGVGQSLGAAPTSEVVAATLVDGLGRSVLQVAAAPQAGFGMQRISAVAGPASGGLAVTRLLAPSDGLGLPRAVVRAEPWWTAVGALPGWLFVLPAGALGLVTAAGVLRRRRSRG